MVQGMKWFWYSLIVFCVLMCSCKTKKVAHENNFVNKEKTETNYTKYQALVDTTRILKIGIDKSKLTITEHITITKYDKDTGAVTEKTETGRKIAQDSDKVDSKEETERIDITSQGVEKYFREIERKHFSETKEESIGGQETFGMWFGITIGCVIGLLIIYLLNRLRIN